MVWLTFRFKKPGMSGSIKKEIRARYVEYVVLYAMFSWPICHLTKPSYRYIPTANAYLGGTIFAHNYLEAITLLSGFFIAASRMRDRLLQQKTRNVFMRMTCRKHRTNKIPINAATLNTFLTKSLNTELVVTILKGITVLAAGSSDSADNMNEGDMLKVRQSSTIEIDKIRIGNAQLWEIGEKKSELNIADNAAGFDSEEEDSIQVDNNDEDTQEVVERTKTWV